MLMDEEGAPSAGVHGRRDELMYVGLPARDADGRYAHWKEHHVPLLYDWILSSKTIYQSTCVRWSAAPPERLGQGSHYAREITYTERTGNSADPNTLEIARMRVPAPQQTRPNVVAQRWSDDAAKPLPVNDLRVVKRIFHPGEVNAIRAPKPGILITHTDSPEIFVWCTDHQPHREDRRRDKPNKPDAVLAGHTDNAEYAVETHLGDSGSFWVASGGKDKRVLLWNVASTVTSGRQGQVQHNYDQEFTGHSDTVEDVSFDAQSQGTNLASVGDDACLALWDRRVGSKATTMCKGAHKDDINTVDWNPVDGNVLLTGGDDNCVRVWDRRKVVDAAGNASPVQVCSSHVDKLTRVQWHRFSKTVFGSASNDEQMMIWDLAESGKIPGSEIRGQVPAELLFCHVGHRGNVVDFQWSEDESDPWLITSVSEDGEGSTLQAWRIFDLIYRPKVEAASEIRALRNSTLAR